MLFFLSVLQQRRAGEADEHRVRQDGLHRLVQLARLGAVALVHEHEEVALRLEAARQRLVDSPRCSRRYRRLRRSSSLPPNLWISEQISQGVVSFSLAIRSAPLFVRYNLLVDALEDLFDLLVEFGAVGDDQNAGVRDVLANPLGEPDHGQALAGALRVPDDAALAALHVLLRGAHAEILVVPAESSWCPASNTMKSWISSRKRALLQSWISARSSGFSTGLVFLPGQIILLRGLDRRRSADPRYRCPP